MKKPTLAKLDLEKERLYKDLEGLPLSERLETYGLIFDVILMIKKLKKISEIIGGLSTSLENYPKSSISSWLIKNCSHHLF